jgi:hypothetical protein
MDTNEREYLGRGEATSLMADSPQEVKGLSLDLTPVLYPEGVKGLSLGF